jgi:hypothetical protein
MEEFLAKLDEANLVMRFLEILVEKEGLTKEQWQKLWDKHMPKLENA